MLGTRCNSVTKQVSFVPSFTKNLIQISVYLLLLTLLCKINIGSSIRNG